MNKALLQGTRRESGWRGREGEVLRGQVQGGRQGLQEGARQGQGQVRAAHPANCHNSQLFIH